MSRISPKILIGILLAAFFIISLSFRILLPFDQVFSGDWIKFTTTDAYYYMRLVDTLVYNFPHLTQFDPFFLYPGGEVVSSLSFYNWFLAGIIWLVGLGSPTQHTVDVVGVIIPSLLAALTIIPIYFIGKTLFNRWVGVLAAGLMAVFPGEFMGRSILGNSDTPAAETLFTVTAMAFLVLAIHTAGQRQLTLTNVLHRDWKVILKPLVFSLIAGFFIGLYLVTWQGGLLFIFIITVYFLLQLIINHYKKRPSDHLGFTGVITFLVALIIYLPFSLGVDFVLAIVVALIIPPVLSGISRLMSGKNMKSLYYPITLLVIGAIFLGVFYVIAPNILHVMFGKFGLIFNPGGATAATTQEMQRFLTPSGEFSTFVAWGQFTTSFFLVPGWPIPGFGIIAFIALIVIAIKQRNIDESRLLFLVWLVVILIATLAQRRFAYYLVANVAILAGYFSWQAIWFAGLRKLSSGSKEIPEKVRSFQEDSRKPDYYKILGVSQAASYKDIKKAYRKLTAELRQQRKPASETEEKAKEVEKAYEVISNPEKRSSYDKSRRDIAQRKKVKSHGKSTAITVYHINTIIAIVLVFLLVFLQNISLSKRVASQIPYAPTDGWQEALIWMDENTPQPLGDPYAYYGLYEAPPWGVEFDYPESAYGVTSWWDYGYWISRIAHRIPSANPSQEPEAIRNVANLFLSQDEATTSEIVEKLDSSYIIADYPVAVTKFHALPTWAGGEESQYYDIFVVPFEGEQNRLLLLYYPEYYKTLYARLYNLNDEPVDAEKPWVITWEYVTISGQKYKYVTDRKGFSNYQEALEYQRGLEDGNHRIVSFSPFISPIPQESVDSYGMVYSSSYLVEHVDLSLENEIKYVVSKVPEIKIFEYLK